MKKTFLIIVLSIVVAGISQAQNVNWRSINNEQNNIVSVQFGLNFGTTLDLGYYRSLGSSLPLLVGGDLSIPAGEDFMDDFKIRLGGQIEVFEVNGFSFSGKILANYRRHETSMVRMQSFGAEFGIQSGYYKPTWHTALEVGFDKAISTHLQHTDIMKDVYADVKDGWYMPTGGNWYFGLLGSKTIGKSFDMTLRTGVTTAEGKDEDSQLPFYMQIGFNKRF